MNGDETFIVCFYLQYKPQALVAQTYHPLCKRYGIKAHIAMKHRQ